MSRWSIASASSAFSSANSRPISDPYKDQFDEWSLIKRKAIDNEFCMTSKFRMNLQTVRRIKTVIVTRKRKRHGSNLDHSGEQEEQSDSTIDSQTFEDEEEDDFFDIFEALNNKLDLRRIFSRTAPSVPNSRPVSGVEYNIIEDLAENGTPAQKLYLKKCRDLQITPSALLAKRLNTFSIEIPHLGIGPEGAHACAVALSKTSIVHILNLSDNGIGPEGGCIVGALLRENSHITDVNLSDNNLGILGSSPIFKVVFDLDHLVRLDLSNNNLQDKDGPFIKEMIEDARHLRYLNLSHNELNEIGGKAMGDAIGWNEGLTEIDLSWNHIRRKGAIGIAESLEENAVLKVLKVSWNGFYLDGCRALARTLVINTTLTELDLTSNRIDLECLKKLIQGLLKNTTLQVLRLAHNPITSTGAYEILNFISETSTSGIRKLDLGNQTVDVPFVMLLEQLQNVRSFSAIYGSVNGHKGEAIEECETTLLNENPAIVLVELSNLMGFRLIDLFRTLDKDGSNSLTKDEISKGLHDVNLPLSSKSLDRLVLNLDQDGDGEIGFGELQKATLEHRKLLGALIKVRESRGELRIEDTEIWRIRVKMQALLASHVGSHPAFQRHTEAMRTLIAQMDGRRQQNTNNKTQF